MLETIVWKRFWTQPIIDRRCLPFPGQSKKKLDEIGRIYLADRKELAA